MAFDVTLSAALSGAKMELSIRDQTGRVANFWAFDDEIIKDIQAAGERAALRTQTIAFELCAVDTGFMREHIDVMTSPDLQTWEVGWRAADFFAAGLAFYPMYVVLGTRYMPPRDPLTPAYQQSKPIYLEEITAAIQAGVQRRRSA